MPGGQVAPVPEEEPDPDPDPYLLRARTRAGFWANLYHSRTPAASIWTLLGVGGDAEVKGHLRGPHPMCIYCLYKPLPLLLLLFSVFSPFCNGPVRHPHARSSVFSPRWRQLS